VFSPTHQRWISGIATTEDLNLNGQVLEPKNAEFALPVPLLLDHQWDYPIGEIVEVKTTFSGMTFKARVGNTGLAHLDDAWEALKTGELTAVSVGPRGPTKRWTLEELSICDGGANPYARVEIVWEVHQSSVVHLDGRKSIREIVYRDQFGACFRDMRPDRDYVDARR